MWQQVMKLQSNSGARGIALMGTEYVCDENGSIDVPPEFVDVALANGFALPVAPTAPGVAVEG